MLLLRPQASAQSLKRTEILFENGAISKDNYLQSLAQVRTDEGNKISAENALLLSKLMLYQMLQLDTPFEEFDILVPEVDLTAAAMAGYQREELLESAVEKQPSVQMARYRHVHGHRGCTRRCVGRSCPKMYGWTNLWPPVVPQ